MKRKGEKSNVIFKYNQPITKPKQGSQYVTNREDSVCLNKYTYQFKPGNFLQVTKEIVAITSNPIANV